jgi:hypothetical protein
MNWDDLLPGQRAAVLARIQRVHEVAKARLSATPGYDRMGEDRRELLASEIVAIEKAIERLEGRS